MSDRGPKWSPEASSERLKALVEEPLRAPRVYERMHFLQQFLAEVSFTRRHSSSMAVLLIDVECRGAPSEEGEEEAAFATLGHAIVSAVRAEDMVARFAPEQFSVLCRATSLEQAGILAERIIRLVDALQLDGEGGGGARLDVSVGIAGFPEGGAQSADQVLAVAHDAMRQARGHVGRRVVIGSRAVDKK